MTGSSATDEAYAGVLHQMLRYFLWGREIPTLDLTIDARPGNVQLRYRHSELSIDGRVDGGSYLSALDGLRRPLRDVLSALGPFPPTFDVGLNFGSRLSGPGWRPVGLDLLVYSVLPSICEASVGLAEQAENEGRAEEARELWLYARHLFRNSGAPALALGNFSGIGGNPHVKSYLAEHDPRRLRERLLGGFWRSVTDSDPATVSEGQLATLIEEPSDAFRSLADNLRTRSVVVGMKAYHRFFLENLADPVALVALADSIEWLIDHDTDEPKNMKKLVPLIDEVLFEALEHDSYFVRKRYRTVGGVWLNAHLLELSGERDRALKVFESIVDDCALIRLFAVGGGFHDKPGIADLYAARGDSGMVDVIERYDVYAPKERARYRFRRWRAESHFGPDLPEPHPDFEG